MANKRQLKKHIRNVCGDLAAEILIARAAFDGFADEAVNEIVNDIANLQVNALAATSYSYDKVPHDYAIRADYNRERHNYNRKAMGQLLNHFNEKVAEIVKKMNAAMPQAVKDANKKN